MAKIYLSDFLAYAYLGNTQITKCYLGTLEIIFSTSTPAQILLAEAVILNDE